jgi:hypothetical protein
VLQDLRDRDNRLVFGYGIDQVAVAVDTDAGPPDAGDPT